MIPEVSSRLKAIEILHQAGIDNPVRLVDLIRKTINFLELDLSELTVLTEAASGPYVVTPVIAALAGAERVIALTQESSYANVKSVIAQTQALETLCQLQDRVEIHARRSLDLFAEADIVTNLGFVRPIDAAVVQMMKPTAVLPLMCESIDSFRRIGLPHTHFEVARRVIRCRCARGGGLYSRRRHHWAKRRHDC